MMTDDDKNLDVPMLLTKCMRLEWGFVPNEKTRTKWIKEGINGERLFAFRASDSPFGRLWATRRILRDFCTRVEKKSGQPQTRPGTRGVDVAALLAEIQEL